MADILIRGMEMPRNCMVCDFRNRGFDLNGDLYCNCRVTKEDVPDIYNIRMESCPLVELPEHGDLIDRSKIKFTCASTTPDDLDYARRYVIDRMPVIVPPNKEETE